jgi:Glucanosyltransferase
VVLDRFNANVDHSECMKLLQESGIYVLGRLYESPYYRKNGQSWFEYDYNLFDRYKATVDSLQKYSNILGLYMSFDDEKVEHLSPLPFQKAFTRDIKAYIKSKQYRTIPVGGFVHKHGMSTSIAQFWGCGNHEIAADFFLVEATQESDPLRGETWCTNSSADYSELIGRYRSFQVPLVFSYGCNQSLQHGYEEVQQIYSDDVTTVFSGVVISEWFNNKRPSGDKGIFKLFRLVS